MPLLIVCPSGHRLKVPKKHAGSEIACPVCDSRISVPPLQQDGDRPSPAKAPLLRPIDQGNSRDTTDATRGDALDVADESLLHPFPFAGVSPEDLPSLDTGFVPVVIEEEAPAKHSGAEQGFDREQTTAVWLLGLSAVIVAVFAAVPSVLEQVNARRAGLTSVDTWTYIVLLGATVQLASAIYALRLPDWSTCWVMSLVATGVATLYATGLALTMFASQEHQLVGRLGLLDEAFHHRAQLWCFLVMCILLILAYSYGRFSVRWYQTECRLSANRPVPGGGGQI